MNPEFRRNLLIQLTPNRLIITPIMLALIFVIFLDIDGNVAENLANTSEKIIYLALFLGGIVFAGNSITTEIQERTWDAQKMSALGPWQMTWGKIFGSTSYMWYISLLASFVYLTSTLFLESPSLVEQNLKNFIIILISGIGLQSFGLLINLIVVRANIRHYKVLASIALFLVTACFLPFSIISAIREAKSGIGQPVLWYGINTSSFLFSLVSRSFFSLWSLIGAYRLMKLELRFKNTGFFWVTFCLMYMAYMAGFPTEKINKIQEYTNHAELLIFSNRLLEAWTAAMVLSHVSIFTEPKNPIQFRNFFLSLKKRQLKNSLYKMPVWIYNIIILLLLGSFIVMLSLLIPFNEYLNASRPSYEDNTFSLLYSLSSRVLFLLRDLGILLSIRITPSPKKIVEKSIFAFTLLYILPIFFMLFFDLEELDFLLLYTGERSFLLAVMPALVQVLAVWAIVYQRWNKFNQSF